MCSFSSLCSIEECERSLYLIWMTLFHPRTPMPSCRGSVVTQFFILHKNAPCCVQGNVGCNSDTRAATLLKPLPISPLFPTIRTIPLPRRLLLHPHTTPMKPLIRTRRIITSNHISITHTLTNTILLIIPIPLILRILHLHILIILIPRRTILFTRRNGSPGFFIPSTTAAGGVLFRGSDGI